MIRYYIHSKPFPLECGEVLDEVKIGYTTYGTLSPQKDNVVWMFHAFSMDTHCDLWWSGLVGKGKLIDTSKFFIICVNMPGSCYGSVGPLEKKPHLSECYYHDFPLFTSHDMVNAYKELAAHLGIYKAYIGIGGSTGGMQLLEWATAQPSFFDTIIPIAVGAYTSPWHKAVNTTQRMSIEADTSWKEKHPKAGIRGMKAARAMAMTVYRNYTTYQETQLDEDNSLLEGYKSDSYQRYQAEKFAERFNAFSYYTLTKMMDAYHLGRHHESCEQALQSIQSTSLIIGFEEDRLFPIQEQEFIAAHIPNATLARLHSVYGHDGFLIEYSQLEEAMKPFIQ